VRGCHRRTIPVRATREKGDEFPVLLAEFFGKRREYLRREVVFNLPIDFFCEAMGTPRYSRAPATVLLVKGHHQ